MKVKTFKMLAEMTKLKKSSTWRHAYANIQIIIILCDLNIIRS